MAGRSGRVVDLDVRAGVGRALERLHHLQHVKREVAAGPVRPAGADGVGHIGDADDAEIALGMAVLGRHRLPIVGGRRQLDLAAEEVRVGHHQRAIGAVDLDRRMAVARHVEAHGERDDGAGDELQRAGDMGRDLDRNLCALQRLAGDQPLVAERRGDAATRRTGPSRLTRSVM